MHPLILLSKPEQVIHSFIYDQPFALEGGDTLDRLEIGYHVYGQLNERKDNVVWVCHALTASADAADWWKGLVGEGAVIDPATYFIVCANIVGSCYGSSGPATPDECGEPRYAGFPSVTIRDMVRAHMLLRKHLGIEKIFLLMGGSMGGYQALEWCVMESAAIGAVFLIATAAAETAWGIAIHAAQRLAIEADPGWKDHREGAGAAGLKAARGFGVITYRNYDILKRMQTDPDTGKLDRFKAASYIEYQGEKLVRRFSAQSYWLLSKSMDSHQLARGRANSLEVVLAGISQPMLIIGITGDILCPAAEQQFIAAHVRKAKCIEIDSAYGHDGFIIETQQIGYHLADWLKQL